MKNSDDTIGNQTRNLLGCSTVPQPTAPPCTSQFSMLHMKIMLGDFKEKSGREDTSIQQWVGGCR